MLDRNGLEVIEPGECLRLLRTVPVGRVGVTIGSLPAILPVNHIVDGDRVIIRSAAGTKLHAALSNTVVAFEADDFAPDGSWGWSVLVRGRAYELTRPEDLEVARHLHLRAWAGDFEHFVAVRADRVSGRRIPARDGAPAPSAG